MENAKNSKNEQKDKKRRFPFSPRSKSKDVETYEQQKLAVLSSEFGEFVSTLNEELADVKSKWRTELDKNTELTSDNEKLCAAMEKLQSRLKEKTDECERVKAELSEEKKKEENAFFRNFVVGQAHLNAQY